MNILRRRITVERNAVTVGTEVVVGTPKTHERRTVIMPASVARLLEPVLEGKGPDDLLWPRGDGSPMRPPSHGDWYYTELGRCMAADGDFPRVTPHGLRHVAAGLMVSAGANVKLVQRQLGHSSAAMTLDVYAELWDEDLESVGSAVDAKISHVVKLSSNYRQIRRDGGVCDGHGAEPGWFEPSWRSIGKTRLTRLNTSSGGFFVSPSRVTGLPPRVGISPGFTAPKK